MTIQKLGPPAASSPAVDTGGQPHSFADDSVSARAKTLDAPPEPPPGFVIDSDHLDVAPSLYGVDAADLGRWRAHAWPGLAPICERYGGHYWPEDLWALCEAKALRLWIIVTDGAPSGVILTEIVRFPRGKPTGRIFGSAGCDLAGTMELVLDVLAAWAKEVGCDRLMAWGSPDWVMSLPGMGLNSVLVQRVLV